MTEQPTADATLDLDQYRQHTRELVASIDETTALVGEMSENMRRLSGCFEAFGETKHQLREARDEMDRTDAPTEPAPAKTGQAAD